MENPQLKTINFQNHNISVSFIVCSKKYCWESEFATSLHGGGTLEITLTVPLIDSLTRFSFEYIVYAKCIYIYMCI